MNTQQLYIAFATIVTKEVRRFMRIWPQTLLPPAITMALYFVIFGNLIGSRIGQMGGFDYIQFIVPGLIMMSVITNSYANVSASFFSLKFQRSIEELIASPIPHHVILLGFVAGGVLRGLLVGFIVTLVSLAFTHLHIYSYSMTILTILLTAILFSLGGFVNAVFAKTFDDISLIPTFVLTPLTYLGGVFYSLSLLAPFWQKLSLVNPIVYMVNAFRYGFIGHSDISLSLCLSILVACCLILYLLALKLMREGMSMK